MTSPDSAIVNIVRVTANPGKEQQLRDVILSSVGRALASPGNHGFSLHVSNENPADFLIVERWASRAQHQEHEHDPAMPQMMKAIQEGNLIKSGPQDTEWTQLT